MNRWIGALAFLASGSLAVVACSDDNGGGGGMDASTGGTGATGNGGSGNTPGAGGSGKAGSGGTSTGGTGTGGGTAGSAGKAGSGGGTAGTAGSAGSAGKGGSAGGGVPDGGPEAGPTDAGGDAATEALIARGSYLVNVVVGCGGCHTDRTKPTAVLGGNANFRTGLPAPNLTSDATGLGSWTDDQIKRAFTQGIDDQDKPLSPVMPYQLFHNLTDDDANAIVAYLRSLPHVQNDVGEKAAGPDAGMSPERPFALSVFPDTTLAAGDANHAAAEAGRYLLSSAAQCARCHSPAVAGFPDLSASKTFTGGAPNPNATPANQYAPNITPDATGIMGWTADDVVTLLKTGVDKGGKTICGPMAVGPNGAYGKLTDADAHAIGVYLTTIPAVANSAANPANEPNCP